jgi:hypothetical protein
VWLKCTLVAVPFLFLATDIISWYMVKVFHPFAWITMGAGALMGLCFASMWFVAMYQIWFSSTPAPVASRDSREPTLVG